MKKIDQILVEMLKNGYVPGQYMFSTKNKKYEDMNPYFVAKKKELANYKLVTTV